MPRIRIIGKKYAPPHESRAASGGRKTRRSSSAIRNFARRSERSAPIRSAGGGMDWPRGTLSACCCASTAPARSASKSLARRFASITVTPPGRCADCFAARATWGLAASMTIPGCCGGRPRTWKTGGGRQTLSRPSLHGSRLPSPWLAVSLTASRPNGAGRRSSPGAGPRPRDGRDVAGNPRPAVTQSCPAVPSSRRAGRGTAIGSVPGPVPLSPALVAQDAGQQSVTAKPSRCPPPQAADRTPTVRRLNPDRLGRTLLGLACAQGRARSRRYAASAMRGPLDTWPRSQCKLRSKNHRAAARQEPPPADR
jgi:hypothetical protein